MRFASNVCLWEFLVVSVEAEEAANNGTPVSSFSFSRPSVLRCDKVSQGLFPFLYRPRHFIDLLAEVVSSSRNSADGYGADSPFFDPVWEKSASNRVTCRGVGNRSGRADPLPPRSQPEPIRSPTQALPPTTAPDISRGRTWEYLK